MSIAKQIILQELEEQSHLKPVEDVIFWALEYYAKHQKDTNGSLTAYCIKQRILDAEKKKSDKK
jgi:hypothetical protein